MRKPGWRLLKSQRSMAWPISSATILFPNTLKLRLRRTRKSSLLPRKFAMRLCWKMRKPEWLIRKSPKNTFCLEAVSVPSLQGIYIQIPKSWMKGARRFLRIMRQERPQKTSVRNTVFQNPLFTRTCAKLEKPVRNTITRRWKTRPIKGIPIFEAKSKEGSRSALLPKNTESLKRRFMKRFIRKMSELEFYRNAAVREKTRNVMHWLLNATGKARRCRRLPLNIISLFRR